MQTPVDMIVHAAVVDPTKLHIMPWVTLGRVKRAKIHKQGTTEKSGSASPASVALAIPDAWAAEMKAKESNDVYMMVRIERSVLDEEMPAKEEEEKKSNLILPPGVGSV